VLHARIARRFELMMGAGLLDEVARLKRRDDLSLDLPAIRAVGYRQLWQHLAGEYSRDEAVAKAIAATRQLAKRQLTWLRKWQGLNWLYTDEKGNLVEEAGSEHAKELRGQKPLGAALNYLALPPV